MALVTLVVGGRRYELACRDGEEAHLQRLAALVDARIGQTGRSLGATNEARQLLLAALVLADDLIERDARPAPPLADDPTEGLAEALDTLATRVEKLADALEMSAEAS